MDKKLSRIKERALEIAVLKGIPKEKFCQDIGMTYGSFKGSQLKTSLNSDAIDKIISLHPDINLNWLITGKGSIDGSIETAYSKIERVTAGASMLNDVTSAYRKVNNAIGNVIEIVPEGKFNTVIADIKASAGMGALLESPNKIQELPGTFIPNAPFGLNIAFQIDGDSMHPTIRHLDFVAGNKLEDMSSFRDGYVYVFVDKYDGLLCKRMYRRGDQFEIVSENKDYPSYFRSQDDIVGIFRAFWRSSSDFRYYNDDEIRNEITWLKAKYEQLNARVDRIDTPS